ncbi:HAMP domain-containing protein [Rheinheimera mesophila]|uniref:histidine kinase n=1 Tax=Rheinheimera mesophila TaxID=1547515 RepID=A0A3P3QKP5_9GAMM|nr:HAMP domain-containing sensor histidine kinase [Rheinheimera mesophila]RRJ21009.1 HAMP domain-containing protein [Rheinheimera mesophila]
MKTNLFLQIASNRRLAWRMLSTMLVLTISAAVIASLCQIYLGYQQAVHQINSRYTELEQGILPGLTNALWTMDDARITAHLESLMSVRDVGSIRLQDELGQVQQRHRADFGAALSVRSFELYHTEGEERHKVGTLDITMSRKRAEQKLKEIAQTTAITTLSILSVSAIVMLWLFHRWISQPLNRVATYAEQIDFNHLGQDLSLNRRGRAPSDELDIVVQAINKLRWRVQQEFARRNQAETELMKHRDQLEQLVAERTLLLEQQSAELAEQNVELNAYAHTVAHDLKHPLTSLIGFSSLLSQPELGLTVEQQQQYLLLIKQSALKMNSIINALLQLANVRSDTALQISVVDMELGAAEAIKRLESFAKEHQATLHKATELPQALGHPQWIEEVWVNYLSNAIKYGGPHAEITVGAEPQGNMIHYWVRDQGQGVQPEHRAGLFQAFNRLDTLKADGHGLGLSIVKRIVSKLGGEVGYDFDTSGSVFWFTLPAAL